MSLVSTLLEVIVLIITIVPAHASGTPATKCAAAKQKAAVKKLGSKLKCYQKASADGVPVDGACLTAAETKFAAAITKADAKGGCVGGFVTAIESDVDQCLTAIRNDTPDALPTCGGSSDPQCGGTCTGAKVCRPYTEELTMGPGIACGGPSSECLTGCQCVDDATACNAQPCTGTCVVNSDCDDLGVHRTERCCSGGGDPCDVQHGPQCCCGTCVQEPGFIGFCQNDLGCNANRTATMCQ